MKKKVKEGDFVYYYYYDDMGKLINIKVYQGRFFKKYYGEYEFLYDNNNLLISQISKIEGIGITEKILYFYEGNNLIRKEYYNKESLRYTVLIYYRDGKPYFMDIKRMGMEFFKTDNIECINQMIGIVGKDFEGSFYLLDLVDKFKVN